MVMFMKNDDYIPLVSIERHLLLRYCIMMHQLGNVGGDIAFYLRGIDGNLDKFDQVRIKINIADALFQLHLLCKDLNLNINDVLKIGEERYEERKKEFKKANKEKLFV